MHRNYNDCHRVINNTEEKQCIECEQWFLMNDINFGRNKGSGDGFNVRCKSCQRKKNKNYYALTGDHQRELARKRLENEEIKSYQQRYFHFWYIKNREKDKANTNKYREEHPEYVKYHNQKYLDSKNYLTRNNKYRNHEISKIQWELCKQYFDYQCAYCGLPLSEHFYERKGIIKPGDFHKEHIIHDGKNNLKNCVPSCQSCNSKKHTTSFNNWYNPNNPIYNKERYLKIYEWFRYGFKQVLKSTYKPKENKI